LVFSLFKLSSVIVQVFATCYFNNNRHSVAYYKANRPHFFIGRTLQNRETFQQKKNEELFLILIQSSGRVQQSATSKSGQPGADKRGIQQAVSSYGFYFGSPKHLILTECSTVRRHDTGCL